MYGYQILKCTLGKGNPVFILIQLDLQKRLENYLIENSNSKAFSIPGVLYHVFKLQKFQPFIFLLLRQH